MTLPRVLALADVVLIPPRGGCFLFLLRGGQWCLLWVVSHQILFCQFFYSGILVANNLSPFSGSWDSCQHLGVLKGHSPDWGSHCVSRGNPGGFQIQSPHRSSYNQHTSSFFFSLVRWGEKMGTTWVSTLVGLVAQLVSGSFGSPHQIQSKRLWHLLPSVRQSILDINLGRLDGGFRWWDLLLGWTSEWWRVGAMCPAGFCRAWLHVSDIGCGGQGNGAPCGIPMSQLMTSGIVHPRFQKTSYLLKVTTPHMLP